MIQSAWHAPAAPGGAKRQRYRADLQGIELITCYIFLLWRLGGFLLGLGQFMRVKSVIGNCYDPTRRSTPLRAGSIRAAEI
jgi:hypothetical protein